MGNQVPINGEKESAYVNYFSKITYETEYGRKVLKKTESWVTDMTVNKSNVALFAKGAKTKWKIENECFNTTKNQGYNLEHNFGHGEKNLSFNFYLLIMLSFLLHQIFELCDSTFKACRKKKSRKELWNGIRTLVEKFVFSSWKQLLNLAYCGEGAEISKGIVLSHMGGIPPPT